MEANGNIYIWHDSDEKKSSWSIDIVPYIQNKRWKSCGKTEFEIACHIQVGIFIKMRNFYENLSNGCAPTYVCT